MLLFAQLLLTALLAAAAIHAAKKSAAIRSRLWLLFFLAPLAIITLIIFGRRSTHLSFLPPISWTVHPYIEPLLMALAIPLLLGTLANRLKPDQKKWPLRLLTTLMFAYYVLYPQLAPILARHWLAGGTTHWDSRGACLQSHDYTCGPAAAATCLRIIAAPADEAALAVDAASAPGLGTDPLLLADAMTRASITRRITWQYRWVGNLDHLQTPAVVSTFSWKYGGHYLAVLSITPDWLLIADPLSGACKWSRADFLVEWTGAAIAFTKDPLNSFRASSCSSWLRGNVVVLAESPMPDPTKLTLAIRPNPKIFVNVVHEDPAFLVVEKPAGVVTQPGKGHASDSLLNGLFALHSGSIGKQLHNLGERRDFGLLHRLDRETSGLLVVAKSPNGYDQLRRDFEARKIDKEYLALVCGIPRPLQGVVQARLKEVEVPNESASYKAASIKKSVISRQGQEAITAYRTLSHVEQVGDIGSASLLKLTIKTGRLHQIRAHMLFLNCEVLGDDIYHAPNITAADYPHAPRLCLHAGHLGFRHPVSEKWLHFYSPLPADLARYGAALHLEIDKTAWLPAAQKTE